MRPLKNGDLEVVLDGEHGFIRRTVYEEAVGRSEAVLNRLANENQMVMRSIATVDGCVISVAQKAGSYTVWARVPGIKITGNFKVIGEGKIITPDFWGSRNGGGMQLSLPWVCHPTMALYFVVLMDKPNANFRTNHAYITGADTSGNVKGWLLPPLANLYEDGRICMGREPIKCFPTIGDQWLGSLQHFNSAQFNADLSSRLNQATVAAQLSWNAADNKQIPIPDAWYKNWTKVNSTIYTNIT